MASETYYLWSRLRNGGEVQEINVPGGGTRTVVSKRNILMPGEKVTQAKLEVDDAQWEEYVNTGVVRPYPFPDMPAGSTDSPLVVLRRGIREAATSEEERLMATVVAAGTSDEDLADAAKVANQGGNK